jgi:hypothetical protein
MGSCKKTELTTDSTNALKQPNYITHLNGVLEQFSKDSRMNPTHISLYMALFQFWNRNFFSESFRIYRDEIMKLSKIGSKTTYYRCLKDLSRWKYIVYEPSHNIFTGCLVSMTIYGSGSGPAMDPSCPTFGTGGGPAVGPYIKQKQTIENRKTNRKNDKDLNFKDSKNKKLRGQNQDNLRTREKKNYNKPL